jgi:hypothetical protein
VKASKILARARERLTVASGPAGSDCRLADNLPARHGGTGEDTNPVVLRATVVALLQPGDDREIGPVYRWVPGGVVVSIRRVLVRFARDTPAADREAALVGVGCWITETLPYPRDAGWARAAADGIVGSLHLLDRLATVRGVQSAQPELIGERS